jgi:hypothetical protein
MNFQDNEKGVSEVIGALLIFLILVFVLGSIQVYEVPKWNKELEIQQFDKIHNDFLNLRSDIEEVFTTNIPKTSSLSLGVRYPERFLLYNPGIGADGTLTFEPVNVTLIIGSNSSIKYTSTRIRYSMNGISNQPKLVYEHGLVINDFGNVQLNEGDQGLISGNDIFVPILFSQEQSVAGIIPQSFDIMPLSSNYYGNFYNNYSTGNTTIVNITLETQYPDLWRNLANNIPGVNVTGTGSAGKINIIKNVTALMYPTITSGGIYSGMITTEFPAGFSSIQNSINSSQGPPGPTGPSGPMGPPGPINMPPFTNINISQPYYPYIQGISITSNGSNYDINANVYNASSTSQIHADLTDITTNYTMFDVNPNYYSSNIAKWYNISIPSPPIHDVIVGTFWVRNNSNSMQFYTQAVFYYPNNGCNNNKPCWI